MTSIWRTRAILAAPLLAAGLLAVYSPGDDGPTLCPFALITGTACPGCGMTRAIGHLAHGDLAGALTYHPLVLLIAIQAVAGWIWLALRARGKVGQMSARLNSAILVGTAVSLIAVWLLRMYLGILPSV